MEQLYKLICPPAPPFLHGGHARQRYLNGQRWTWHKEMAVDDVPKSPGVSKADCYFWCHSVAVACDWDRPSNKNLQILLPAQTFHRWKEMKYGVKPTEYKMCLSIRCVDRNRIFTWPPHHHHHPTPSPPSFMCPLTLSSEPCLREVCQGYSWWHRPGQAGWPLFTEDREAGGHPESATRHSGGFPSVMETDHTNFNKGKL